MSFEELLQRDLKYPAFMDWPITAQDEEGNYVYTDKKNNRKVFHKEETLTQNVFYGERTLDISSSNTLYLRNDKTSRVDGPAVIDSYQEFDDIGNGHKDVTLHWMIKGQYKRKNGMPPFVEFKKDEKTDVYTKIYLEWHGPKADKYIYNNFHRIGGPAKRTIKKNKSESHYYINGRHFRQEYKYWTYVAKNYKGFLPKIISENDVKIVFESDINKPCPKMIYKNRNYLVWEFEGVKMKALDYWTKYDNLNLEKWLAYD